MKRLLFFALLMSSLHVCAQCTECESLEEALKKPGDVRSLKMNGFRSGIVLETLPESIEQLIHIRVLYLSDHNFTSIPAGIGKLQNLKELSFAGCKLEKLPDEIFLLKNLKELILLENEFSGEYKKSIKEKSASLLPGTKVLL